MKHLKPSKQGRLQASRMKCKCRDACVAHMSPAGVGWSTAPPAPGAGLPGPGVEEAGHRRDEVTQQAAGARGGGARGE